MKISLTFDDGLRSQYTDFYPILKKHGLKSTFYIDTANINKKGRLTFDQINGLYKNGNEIGSHTHTHCHLTKLSEKEIQHEFKKSNQILKKFNVKSLAYPFGDYNEKAIKQAKTYFQSARAYSSKGFNVNTKPYNRYALATISFDKEGFFSTAMGFPEFKKRIKKLIEKCEKRDCWIIFTFHGRYILSSKDRLNQIKKGITLKGILDFILNKIKNPSVLKKFDFFCSYIKKFDVMPVSEVLESENK